MNNGETFESRLESLLGRTESLPYLFVGSGFSRRYLQLPDWEGLLKHFAEICLPDNQLAYMTFQHIAGTESDLPKIAQVIESKFNDNWYNEITRQPQAEIDAVKRANTSPFKCKVSIYLNNFKNLPSQGLFADELALFNRIAKHSISGIITTNYDCLLERLLPDYGVYCCQDDLLFSPLQDVYEIYKIHGSITKPSTIVLTQKDYEIQEKKTAYLAAKLLTIFVEHPIVFLGYSVKDSDIKNILFAISECLSEEQLDKLKNRMFFVNWQEGKKDCDIGELLYPFENGKYLPMTQLTVGDYKTVFSVIAKKQSQYELSVLRRLKRDVYKVVLNNEEGAEKYIKVINLEGSENSNIKKVAGVSRNDEQEYSLPDKDELYFDIVLDNKHYDAKSLIERSMETLLKHNSKSLPIFKYLLAYESNSLPDYINDYVVNAKLEMFFTENILKKRKKGTITWLDFKNEYQANGFKALAYFDIVKFEELDCKNMHKFLTDLIVTDLKMNLDEAGSYKSFIRKMIKVLDWLLYGKKVLEKYKYA